MYRAYKHHELAGWKAVGEFATRKEAIKAMGVRGAVVFDCTTRRFLSTNKPYTMPRATVEQLREFPENRDLTI